MNDYFKFKEGEKSLGFFLLRKFNHSEKNQKQRISINEKVEWNN